MVCQACDRVFIQCTVIWWWEHYILYMQLSINGATVLPHRHGADNLFLVFLVAQKHVYFPPSFISLFTNSNNFPFLIANILSISDILTELVGDCWNQYKFQDLCLYLQKCNMQTPTTMKYTNTYNNAIYKQLQQCNIKTHTTMQYTNTFNNAI